MEFELTKLVVMGTDCTGSCINPTTLRSRTRRSLVRDSSAEESRTRRPPMLLGADPGGAHGARPS